MLEKRVFSDPAVEEEISRRFVAVRVDITKPGHPDEHLLKDTFQSGALPVVALLDSAGNFLPEKTIGDGVDAEGLDAAKYLEILKSVP